MKYIITNFAYGYGPFLRTTELAIAVSDLLSKKIGEKIGVIVPWVYGQKQKDIMQEQFADLIKTRTDFLLLDKNLGKQLDSVFYGQKSYSQALAYLVKNGNEVRKNVWQYFDDGLSTENFLGQKVEIKKNDILLEINRNCRIDFNFEYSYQASFAYASEILIQAQKDNISLIDKEIIKPAIAWFAQIEKKQQINFIAEPATFFYLGASRKKLYQTEQRTPPNLTLPKRLEAKIEKGIYVTVTGIPGLDRLFAEAKKIGLKIYTNQPNIIAGSEKISPQILGNKNILLHFARSGWGSIWLSQFTNTPFIALVYEKNDDPEIYYNNLCLEKTGLGKIYSGQPLAELLKFKDQYETKVSEINQYLLDQYKTLDGISYTAQKIANHYLNSNLL
ncbi:MAG: hypothetical protein WCW26_02950 [Candidatus Buchananbacteria bacterium]